MSAEDKTYEQLMLERILEEIRAMRIEMKQGFDQMSRNFDSMSQQIDAIRHRLSSINEPNNEVPDELVN